MLADGGCDLRATNDSFDLRNRQELASGRTTVHGLLVDLPDRVEQHEWDRESRQQLFEWAAAKARAAFECQTCRAFVLTAFEGRPARMSRGPRG